MNCYSIACAVIPHICKARSRPMAFQKSTAWSSIPRAIRAFDSRSLCFLLGQRLRIRRCMVKHHLISWKAFGTCTLTACPYCSLLPLTPCNHTLLTIGHKKCVFLATFPYSFLRPFHIVFCRYCILLSLLSEYLMLQRFLLSCRMIIWKKPTLISPSLEGTRDHWRGLFQKSSVFLCRQLLYAVNRKISFLSR